MMNTSNPGKVNQNSSATFEDQITTLVAEVELAVRWNRPSILLVVYGSELIHQLAQETLEKRILHLGQKITHIKIDKEHFDIPKFLSQFEKHLNVIFFVSGLRWGGGRSRTNAYQALNIRRELFVDEKIKMILWLNEKEAADLPYHAPDFWAFRHRVIEFTDKVTGPDRISNQEELTWRDWHVQEAPVDLLAKIRLRESMLADLPVHPASLSTRTDLIYTLAYLFWCLQDFARSREYLEKGLTLTSHPQAASVQTMFKLAMGILFHDQLRLDQASGLFQQIIQKEPRNPEAWNNLGRVFHDMGRQNDAVHAYKRSIKLAPKFGNAWNNLGISYRLNDQNQDAFQAFKQATRFAPQNPKPWMNLAHTCLAVGQPDQAIRAFKKATRLLPDDAKLLISLAEIYREMNRMKDAITSYRKALKINPELGLAYAGLAACYKLTGKTDAAEKQIKLGRTLLEKENEFVRAEFEALSENPEAALGLLEIALKKKLVDPGKIQSDPNFKSLHQDPLYQKLMGSTL